MSRTPKAAGANEGITLGDFSRVSVYAQANQLGSVEASSFIFLQVFATLTHQRYANTRDREAGEE